MPKICSGCRKPFVSEKFKTCDTCRERKHTSEQCERHKENREKWKAQGLCITCGTNPVEDGVTCSKCRERQKVYYQENRERMREQHRKYYQENREERIEYKRKYYQTVGGKFVTDKISAERRGYSWQLNTGQATIFYTQPCHYCGEIPNGKLNGIDRQDNSRGYIVENCVPCCPTCNYAKYQMSPEEFIWHCTKVAQFNKR